MRFDEGSTYEKWMSETAADVQDELPMPPAGHPLHKLGERLAHYLDDDKFNECEQLLLEGWDHDRIDRKTGKAWREDSRLEVWFPLTHEEVDRLRAALRAHAAQRDHIEDVLGMVQSVELPEPVCWVCWNSDDDKRKFPQFYHYEPRAYELRDRATTMARAVEYGDAREAAGYARGRADGLGHCRRLTETDKAQATAALAGEVKP